MHLVAKETERPAGAPSYEDVCLRYGWIRKNTFPTVKDAKLAIKAFHATRLDWFYTGSHTMQKGAKFVTPEAKSFIDWCHSQKMKICGTINSNTTDKSWAYKKHHLNRYVGEVKKAEFREMVIEWGKAQIDAGVDTMVCDDIFKYDKIRQDLWNKDVLAKIIAHKPGFTMAGNNGSSISTEYVKRFAVAYHYSDNNFIPTPGQWWKASKDHRSHKSAFLLQPNRKRTKAQLRTMIALAYANGAHLIVPWDAYIHGGKRLFSSPTDYADLYGFLRGLGQAGYLKSYEDAAVGGYNLQENRYDTLQPISIEGGSGKLSAFARAIPKNSEAAIVVHLVESGKSKGSKLKLNNSTAPQLKSNKLKCTLLMPTNYHKATHEAASEKQDFSTLIQAQEIKPTIEEGHLSFDLPPLKPYAVLILTPQ